MGILELKVGQIVTWYRSRRGWATTQMIPATVKSVGKAMATVEYTDYRGDKILTRANPDDLMPIPPAAEPPFAENYR